MKVTISNVRLSFPSLFELDKFKKYSGAFLIEPGQKGLAELEAVCEEVGKAKWGAKWPAIKKELEAGGKMLIQDGNKKASQAGYEGMLYVNASNSVRPLVLDRDKTPLAAGDGKPYAGCKVNAIIDVWAQDNNEFGKRLNGQLQGVQFVEDGDAFGAGGKAADVSDFDEIADGADADDLA